MSFPQLGSSRHCWTVGALHSGASSADRSTNGSPTASETGSRDDRRRRGGDRAAPAAHNPFAVQKPDFVEQVVAEEANPNRNSLLVIDNTDEWLISLFQNWLVDEIMANAASSINVLTERAMPPNSVYHCSLFTNYTLDGIKAVLLFTMSSRTGGPCAQWDSYASRALFHSAFQPFTWPVMFDTSATCVDVKVFNGNEVLFHWGFEGYRSDMRDGSDPRSLSPSSLDGRSL